MRAHESHRRWLRSARWVSVTVVIVVVVGISLVVLTRGGGAPAPASAAASAPAVAGTRVEAGALRCGTGWAGGRTGRLDLAVQNTSAHPMEVYLQDYDSRRVYLDVENIGAGATRAASVTLGPGRYRFVCLGAFSTPVLGPVETVAGAEPAGATPGLIPVTAGALAPAVRSYHAWIAGRLPVLRDQVRVLDQRVRAGDRSGAERAWLTAHLTYETLGAAYDAFGAFDAEINGDTSGFHRIEGLLWHGAPMPAAAAYTARLKAAVSELVTSFPRMTIAPIDMGLRAHEIVENAIEFELNGTTDEGSHTELATIDANLTGSLRALAPLRGILRHRDAHLAQTDAWIARSQRLVRGFHHGDHWTPLTALSRHQRETLDADLTQTAELLSQVAAITEPRRAP